MPREASLPLCLGTARDTRRASGARPNWEGIRRCQLRISAARPGTRSNRRLSLPEIGGTMISRRSLLRGAIGGSVLSLGLPLLEPMLNSHGTALAAGTGLPKRYGFFFWGHGLPLNYRHNAVGTQNGNQFIDVKTNRPDL